MHRPLQKSQLISLTRSVDPPSWVQEQKNKNLSFWLSRLNILLGFDSVAAKESEIKGVQVVLSNWLTELGLDVQLVEPENVNSDAPLVVAERKGRTGKFITFVCHADVVLPNQECPIRYDSKSKKLYGSGVIDNKGGIITLLWGLEQFLKDNVCHHGIRVVCSPSEESGSPGFHPTFKKLAQESDVILGFEPSYDSGDLIVGRRGNLWYDVHVQGKSAHSGRGHQEGVNACLDLVLKLQEIQTLNNYEENVTINIGRIEGGKKHNVVSDFASAQIDARFPCFESRHTIQTTIENCLRRSHVSNHLRTHEAVSNFKIVDDCPPLATSSESLSLFEFYRDQIQRLESMSIEPRKVGGASDANHFSRPDNVVLDGLGPIGGAMHTAEEFLYPESLETRSRALSELLRFLNQKITL